MIVADDMGYADIGVHGSKDIRRRTSTRWRKRAFASPMRTSAVRIAVRRERGC